jgi:hypothetical protein
MDARAVTLVAVACLGVGGVAGWLLHRPPAARPGGPDTREGTPQASSPGLGSDREMLARAQTRLDEETAARKKAETELAAARARLAALAGGTPGKADGGPGKGPAKAAVRGGRYRFQAFQKTLDGMDWKAAGEAVSKMSPLLVELADSMASGQPLPPSVGDIQQYNGRLVKMALTAQRQGVPGTGTNGAFTHPSILANLVWSTLRAAGKPLDAAQEQRLGELADAAVEEDARRLAGYGEDTLALQRVWDETALKDRFYAGVDRLVTDAQREILHPAAVRGRLGFDLCSSGLVWATVCVPLPFTDVAGLKAAAVQRIVQQAQVPAEQRPVVVDAVADWASSFPPGWLDAPSSPLDLGGHMQVARVRVAAGKQLALERALLARLPADAPAAARVRAAAAVLVPVKRP